MTRRIVVGIDGSKEARRALEWAMQEAQLSDAVVIAVHAYADPWGYWGTPVPVVDLADVEAVQRRLLGEEIAAVHANHPDVQVEQEIVNDLPARALLERARDADLLVVGSRGRGGFSGLLLGSVSQQIVHHATCPVAVIPSPQE